MYSVGYVRKAGAGAGNCQVRTRFYRTRTGATMQESNLSMTEKTTASLNNRNETMKITVSRNGPYIVTGGVPLKIEEICNDDEGYCRTWKETKTYPLQQHYALCRCGHSKNRPFCDGSHIER